MQKQSFGSVEVIWLDREQVLAEVEQAALRLAHRRGEVTKVILFGSLARGDAVPGSDADVLVVLASSRKRFLNRIPLYHLDGVSVGVDVFPYTEAELTRMVAAANPFVREALREGVVVYERNQHPASDSALR